MKGKLFGLKTILLTMLTLAIAIPSISIINVPINDVNAFVLLEEPPVANFTIVEWVVGSNFIIVNGESGRPCWNFSGPMWQDPCRFRLPGGSYDPIGANLPYFGIVHWHWDWGDGTWENNTRGAANHTYAAVGTYNITLTVTDDEAWSWKDGASSGDSISKIITVEHAPPIPNMTHTPDILAEGEEITFDASSSTDDGTIVSYEWDFGDGATATGVTTTHTYATEGVYNLNLTCTDDEDLSRTVTWVLNLVPVYTLTVEVAGTNGTAIEGLDVQVSYNPTMDETTDATGTAVFPGLIERLYGVTVTHGTTTLIDTVIYLKEDATMSIEIESSVYAYIADLQGQVSGLEDDILATSVNAQTNLFGGLGGGIVVGLVVGLAIMFVRK
jgi:PKD repeat protein